jgi:hypothetical protein
MSFDFACMCPLDGSSNGDQHCVVSNTSTEIYAYFKCIRFLCLTPSGLRKR